MWICDAPAKVNLQLRVLARETSGYHQIETVFQSLELADRLELELEPGGQVGLEVVGIEEDALGRPAENLAVRAAERFRAALQASGRRAPGVRIRLEKRIPHGAGLGGGSSDAAAVLRGMNALSGDPLDGEALLRIGAELGADVAFFLCGASRALAWGRGERILPLSPLPPRGVLLAVPSPPIATPWAYGVLSAHRPTAGRGPPGPAVLGVEELEGWSGVAAMAWNDFEEALFPHRPELARLKEALARTGGRPSLLSGSGSAVYGVFEEADALEEAAEAAGSVHPDVRVIRTRTRG